MNKQDPPTAGLKDEIFLGHLSDVVFGVMTQLGIEVELRVPLALGIIAGMADALESQGLTLSSGLNDKFDELWLVPIERAKTGNRFTALASEQDNEIEDDDDGFDI